MTNDPLGLLLLGLIYYGACFLIPLALFLWVLGLVTRTIRRNWKGE